jgi:hypothetical protein
VKEMRQEKQRKQGNKNSIKGGRKRNKEEGLQLVHTF